MAAASTVYRNVRAQIEDGDLLLFRRPTSLIAAETDGDYSHSAMALWRGHVLLLAESREWHGARIVTLSSQVRDNPGVIDVYRPVLSGTLMPDRLKRQAADLMVRQAGHPYGYAAILAYSLRCLGLLKAAAWLLRKLHVLGPRHKAPEPGWYTPKFCSTETTWCYRRAGKDLGIPFEPHPGVPSQFVTPNDQARSLAYRLVYPGLTIN